MQEQFAGAGFQSKSTCSRKLLLLSACCPWLSAPVFLPAAPIFLEAEPNLRVDAAIVGNTGATKSAKATSRRSRLSEESRSEVAYRIAQVRMIQQVIEIE